MASIRKTPLTDAEVHPQPLQPKIRIWHGSATAERSVELAAEFGRYHEAFGNRLIAISGQRGSLSQAEFTGSLELFQAEVAPALRRAILGPEWPGPLVDVRRRHSRESAADQAVPSSVAST